MIIQPKQLLWMLCFGFVSGHDFSRAITSVRELGFSPCQLLPGEGKTQGLKAQIFVGPQRPD
jgi:hypothetical protein